MVWETLEAFRVFSDFPFFMRCRCGKTMTPGSKSAVKCFYFVVIEYTHFLQKCYSNYFLITMFSRNFLKSYT